MTTRIPGRPGVAPRAPSSGRVAPRLRVAHYAVVLLAMLLALAVWAMLNQAVVPPEFRGQISGLAFSPFHRGQTPELGREPTAAQISDDLRLVAGISPAIRTYTVQGALGQVPALAAGLGLKITLGAWLTGQRVADQQELDRLVTLARGNTDVTRVLVGNETILRGDLSVAALRADLRSVKRRVGVPVSTAEPWHVWLAHPELAADVDVITVHLLPYWEGLSVDDAVRFSLEKLDAVRAAFPGKPVLVGEVGWPSGGVSIGGARASRVNQADFLRRFMRAAQARGLDYFVMEAFDQPWKTSFEGRAAGYWGMFDLDRAPKWALTGPVREVPGWRGWALASVLLAGCATLALLRARPDLKPHGQVLLAAMMQVIGGIFAALLITMGQTYLGTGAALVWAVLVVAQLVLLLLLIAASFEFAETLWAGGAPELGLPSPPPRGAALPKVSIHVPICNEPADMVRATLDALARLDYPDFEVLVLDNNTEDPALWEPVAEHCAALGPHFRFFHLGRWPGFKAGALNVALRETAGDAEIIAVLDSDYVVARDWLRATVGQFADPAVGFVQSPQDYRDGAASTFKRAMFWEYAGFFRIGMINRDARNAIIMHGTMVLIRRAAIARAGGWAEWSICEDAELGLRLLRAGWRGIYAPRSHGRGVMPDDFAALCRQRFRWASGAMQIMRRHWRPLFSPRCHELSVGQRWHFVTGWLDWVGDALGLGFLLLGLVWSVGLALRPGTVEFPILLFMLPAVVVFVFKLVRTVGLYRVRVACGAADRLGAAVAGLAVSHTIGKAVWRGLTTAGPAFLRTPKCARAPALVQGLVMAREELVILALIAGAALAVGVTHRFATWEASAWVVLLAIQAVPYAAAVVMALGAASVQRLPVQRLPMPGGLGHPAGALARGGDGYGRLRRRCGLEMRDERNRPFDPANHASAAPVRAGLSAGAGRADPVHLLRADGVGDVGPGGGPLGDHPGGLWRRHPQLHRRGAMGAGAG